MNDEKQISEGEKGGEMHNKWSDKNHEVRGNVATDKGGETELSLYGYVPVRGRLGFTTHQAKEPVSEWPEGGGAKIGSLEFDDVVSIVNWLRSHDVAPRLVLEIRNDIETASGFFEEE